MAIITPNTCFLSSESVEEVHLFVQVLLLVDYLFLSVPSLSVLVESIENGLGLRGSQPLLLLVELDSVL